MRGVLLAVVVGALIAGCSASSETNMRSLATSLPHNTNQAAAVWLDDAVYVIGGGTYADGEGVWSKTTVYKFVPESGVLENHDVPELGPYGRQAMVAVAASDGRTILVIGGDSYDADTSHDRCFSTVDRYDPEQGTIETLERMPYGITQAAGAIVGENLYILGGSEECQRPSRSIIEVNLATAESRILSQTLPTAVSNAPAAVINGTIYVIGGMDSNYETSGLVQTFTPSTGRVEALLRIPPVSDASLTTSESTGTIWILGGDESFGKSRDTVLRMRPDKLEAVVWDDKLPDRNSQMASASREGEAYLFGGGNQAKAIYRWTFPS